MKKIILFLLLLPVLGFAQSQLARKDTVKAYIADTLNTRFGGHSATSIFDSTNTRTDSVVNAIAGGNLLVDSILILNSTDDNTVMGRGASIRWSGLYGDYNTFYGSQSGIKNTGGYANSFFGYNAGYNNATGNVNTWLGYQSGFNNILGGRNIGIGVDAGFDNDTSDNIFMGFHTGKLIDVVENRISGQYNMLLGHEQAQYFTTAKKNNFIGYRAGYYTTSGYENVFNGYLAGFTNTTGYYNTFIGTEAGFTNSDGYKNSFMGYRAGYFNSSGHNNTALGNNSGAGLTTGDYNVFIGSESAPSINVGNGNVAIGYRSMFTGSGSSATVNTAIGSYALFSSTSGNRNTVLGYEAGYTNTTGSYNTWIGFNAGKNASQKVDATNSMAIGYDAFTTASHQIVLGNTQITDVYLSQDSAATVHAGAFMVKGSTILDSNGVYAKRVYYGDNKTRNLDSLDKVVYGLGITDVTSTSSSIPVFNYSAITISQIMAVATTGGGAGDSTHFNVCWSANSADGSPSTLFSSDKKISNVTTGDAYYTASFNDATIPANVWVWLRTTTESGAVNTLAVTLKGKND